MTENQYPETNSGQGKFKQWREKFALWSSTNPRAGWAVKIISGLILFGICSVLLLFLLVRIGVFGKLPTERDLIAIQNDTASEVYSVDGEVLGKYFVKNRTNVYYDDISPNLINALVATEDARFFEHQGVDARAWVRVFFRTILMRDNSGGGGSTLSQQLAKNLFPRQRYSFLTIPVSKIKEVYIAKRLERVYSKKELLNLYLNTVPFGGNIYGVSVACKQFFSATPKNIKVQDAALLIGMLKANTSYNPVRNPERALARRNTVLGQMEKYDYLNTANVDSLQALPLELEYSREDNNEGMATYFREHLRLELDKKIKDYKKSDGTPYNIYTDGLKIYTTIDYKMQQYAEEAVSTHLAKLQKDFDAHWKDSKPWGNDSVIENEKKKSKRYKKLKAAGRSEKEIAANFDQPINMTIFDWKEGDVQKEITPLDSIKYYFCLLNTGFLAMDYRTGEIKAWVGGIDHQYYQYDHVKSKRSAGSTFKPIVYASALQQNIAPCEYTHNRLVTYSEYEDWQPRNANNEYTGVYSMEGGLSKSVNSVAVDYIMRTQVDSVKTLAQQMGVTSHIPPVPAIALGAVDVSLYDMLKVYGTIANNGKRPEPYYITKIETSRGDLIAEFEPTPIDEWEQVLTPDNAHMLTKMMTSVIENGTGRRLRAVYNLPNAIAGKTGTTQNHSDGWFIGFTPNIVAGAWVGGESPKVHFRSLSLGSGSNMALPIWGQFLQKTNRDKAFAANQYDTFNPLSDSLIQVLNCAPYLDEMPLFVNEETFEEEEQILEEKIDEFIEIFKKNREKKAKEKPRVNKKPSQRKKSDEVRRKNEKLRKKKKRKEKTKKFLDKIFKN